MTDEVRGKCLSYEQSNASSAEHGILIDMFFESAVLDPTTDYLAFWLYVDDPTNTTPLIVEYASYGIHAGAEMFQGVIDLAVYGTNGSLRAGWNPIVIPLDLKDMNFSVKINANNSPNYGNIFRIRFMNTQSGNSKAVNYKLDDVAFVRGDALKDYQYEDGTTALKDVASVQPSKGKEYLTYIPLDAASNAVSAAGASPAYVNDAQRGSCLSFTTSNTTMDLFVLADFSFDAVSLNSATDSLAFWMYIEDVTNVDTLIVEYSSFRLNAGEEMSQYTLDLAAAVAQGLLHQGWNAIVMPLDLQGFSIPYAVNAQTGTNMDRVIRIRLMNGQNGRGKAQTYKFDDVAFVRGDALADYEDNAAENEGGNTPSVGSLVVEYASYQVHAGEEMSQYTLDLAAAVAQGLLHQGWNAIVMPLDLQGFDIPYVVNAATGTKMDQVMRIRLMNGQNGSSKPLTYKIDDVAFVRGDALADYAE